MSIKKSIGKNTLGGGNKMNVDLKTYNRSTHNLSYAWRSSMTVGTLVPCMKILALPGDTFDLDLEAMVFTHPTIGPMFGTYKLQVDIFTCPFRLYIAMLHNNALNVGMDMSKVKIPKLQFSNGNDELITNENMWQQVNPSSIMRYLGVAKTTDGTVGRTVNAVPLLIYLDIFKNYYANKQEENFYAIMKNSVEYTTSNTLTYDNQTQQVTGGTITINNVPENVNLDDVYLVFKSYNHGTQNLRITDTIYFKSATRSGASAQTTVTVTAWGEEQDEAPANVYGTVQRAYSGNDIAIKSYPLKSLDTLKEDIILSAGRNQVIFDRTSEIEYIGDILDSLNNITSLSYPLCGQILKTYQSDIFNNWVNTDWIEGENGISAITAIDTSSGSFSIDTLNLSKKVYDMLNRIAVSGGTYKDWIDTVYTSGYELHAETPIYEGGMSQTIAFEQVVSNSATEAEPLGTLAGRGVLTDSKRGGKLHIKVKEPSYIVGIVSITPNVDYAQFEDWDNELDTMDDLHKPALDGIGFQDLLARHMIGNAPNSALPPNLAVGKQPAWINYMTNFNKVFGNFAIQGNEAFMCLTKWFEVVPSPFEVTRKQATPKISTYIEPEMYNYIFADTDISAQNFWVQIGFGLDSRRVMSAKQIPNL